MGAKISYVWNEGRPMRHLSGLSGPAIKVNRKLLQPRADRTTMTHSHQGNVLDTPKCKEPRTGQLFAEDMEI